MTISSPFPLPPAPTLLLSTQPYIPNSHPKPPLRYHDSSVSTDPRSPYAPHPSITLSAMSMLLLSSSSHSSILAIAPLYIYCNTRSVVHSPSSSMTPPFASAFLLFLRAWRDSRERRSRSLSYVSYAHTLTSNPLS